MHCHRCGDELSAGRRRFCGKRCSDAFYRTQRVPIVCDACGGTAYVERRDASKRKYCSRECYRGHYNSTHLSGQGNGRWRGGRALAYGPGWKQIRVLVRARDKICRRCGRTPEENGRALDVHHNDPFRFTGDNSLELLEALCRSCHARADDHGRRGSAAFLRKAGRPPRPTKREIRRLKAKLRQAERTARRRALQKRAEQLHREGASLRDIARELGVSHQTVANWLGGRYRLSEAAMPYHAA
ncbi:MAG TPA: helix-turn-helix domain-containing protein [Actinomycetota bacterium]